MKLIYLFLTLALACCTAAPAAEESSGDELSIRLPDTLKPIHYFVQLQPLINGNFSIIGFTEITFSVEKPTNKIIVHILDILTHNDTLRVYPEDGTPEDSLPVSKQEHDVERQFYIVTMENELPAGSNFKMQVHFMGYLADNLAGFYRSSYQINGETRWLATTQFQATDARRAFPCFDEPAIKANFTIEMARQENMTSISNMPIRETVPKEGEEGWMLDKFETSYPMSTYLVAFIVSDFAYLEATDSPNYRFRIYARENAVQQTDYALSLGPSSMQFFEEYFDVPFPLPKQDMAAVPDFGAGAMENWGLIIYRESRLLHDEMTTAADKQIIGVIITHEIAHQWFGDLVTPAWWNDLWLNEGFASYMEYVGLAAVEPSMNPLQQFVVQDLQSAFALDSLESSHPVSVPVNHPDEINEIFDAISYQKGASIIRMMQHYLTEETMRRGLKNYLIDFTYKAPVQDDLWEHMTKQAHEDGTLGTDLTVKQIMDTWTLQMGFPVVTVTNNRDGTAEIKQERFLMSTSSNSDDTHDYKWWIPLSFTSQDNPDFSVTTPTEWMAKEEATKTITVPEGDQWVLFNIQANAFYRVNYDEETWKQLIEQLKTDHEVIHNLNRASLIDDSMNLARAGLLSYEIALDVLSYLHKETDYIPIKSALNNMAYIKTMFAQTAGYGELKKFFLSLIEPHFTRVQFQDSLSDPHLQQLERASVLSMACGLGHDSCIDNSLDLFDQWMQEPDNYGLISPNLKSTVYCTAISEGGEPAWEFAWDRYMTTESAGEKELIMEALGCTKELWIISSYLNRTLTEGAGIRKQDVRSIIPSIAANNHGRLLAWQFMRDNWGRIINYFNSVSFTLEDIVSGVTDSLNTRIQLEEMKAFQAAEEGNFASATRTVQQAAEKISNNLQWMNNHYEQITTWLQNKNTQE